MTVVPGEGEARPLRLLLDEMLDGTVAAELRRLDHDVLAVVDDATLVASSDPEIVLRATAESRAVVTADIGDFSVLARDWRATGRVHGGIVYVASRRFPQDRSRPGRLLAALVALGAGGGVVPGAEVFLSPPVSPWR